MGILVGKYDGAMEPPCAGVSVGDAVGMRVPCIVHKVVAMLALLAASVCAAQSTKVEVVPLKIGGVSVSFPLEVGESGVVPPAEAALSYARATLGKNMRISQCFFVMESGYRRKLYTNQPTTEAEDRKGLHSMIVVTELACDAAALRAARDAAIARSKDKVALTAQLRETDKKAFHKGNAILTPLKVSPEQAAKNMGVAGVISESSRHFTIGIGDNDGIAITTFVCAESLLVVFTQWTDQKNFPHCIERAKAFTDALGVQTKATR